MDVESAFRVTFGIKKEQDIVGLIEAAVSVAALIVPHKLKKHRSRIVKLLFDDDPTNSTDDFFSDDELSFDDDDDEDELLKVTSTPKNTSQSHSHSSEIKKLGFKKTVEEDELSQQVPKMPPLMMVGRQDKSMEATKRIMLERKYPEEEAQKKAAKKRKIQHVMNFPEPKKHCCDDRSKAKPPSGHVRQRTTTFKNELKARQHGNPKPKSKY